MENQQTPSMVPVHVQDGILVFVGLGVQHHLYEKALGGGEIHLQNIGQEQSHLNGVGVQGPKGTFIHTVPWQPLSATEPVRVFDLATMATLRDKHWDAYFQLLNSRGTESTTHLLFRVIQGSGIKHIQIPIEVRLVDSKSLYFLVGLTEGFRDV